MIVETSSIAPAIKELGAARISNEIPNASKEES
jgi:hypothetical protein